MGHITSNPREKLVSSTRAALSVRSLDGTRIAFDRLGDGPPLILVEAALPDEVLAPVLVEFFQG
jgi:hypothetical protein